MELFPADLLKPESIEAAVQGCEYVVHTASPFPLEVPKNEDELVRPAVEGTMAVVRACHKNRVKRLVLTSSVAAIMYKAGRDFQLINTENEWTDTTTCGAYEKSKTLAERAAWDFMNALPEGEKFELVVINPSFIMGPSLLDNGDFSSATFIKRLLKGSYPGMPKIKFGIVDVREVALAHLRGLQVPEARNQRFILNSQVVWFKEMASYLKERYPRNGIKTKEFGYCPVRTLSLVDSSVKLILPMWNKEFELVNTRSREVLGIEYRTAEEAIVAMAESLV